MTSYARVWAAFTSGGPMTHLRDDIETVLRQHAAMVEELRKIRTEMNAPNDLAGPVLRAAAASIKVLDEVEKQ